MKKLLAILAVFALGTGVLACDFGEDEDTTEEVDIVAGDDDFVEEDLVGQICTVGDSAGLVFVRIGDDPDNATLTDCNTNPGADIDAIVIQRPDGEEIFADGVTEDMDVAGDVCPENHKSDIMAVIGQPDACVKELGCGCGANGYSDNPDCDCAGGDEEYLGYYSLNGGAIVVDFAGGAELLCGDVLYIYEMHDPEVTGSEETYTVHYGNADKNWVDTAPDVDWATGQAAVDVEWVW